MFSKLRRSTFPVSVALAASLLTAPALWAIDVPQGFDSKIQIGSAAFTTEGLKVEPTLVIHPMGTAKAALPGLGRFLAAQGDQWEVRFDTRNARPALIQGSGVPLLPGRGNQLTNAEVGLRAKPTLEDAERVVRGFLEKYPEVLNLQGFDLRLDRAQSLGYGGYYWNVVLQQFAGGLPVADAYAFFRINNGNLVQFGVNRIADVNIDTQAGLSADDSFAAAVNHIGLLTKVATRTERGKLQVLPIAAEGDHAFGEPYEGLAGAGYRHVLAYEHIFVPEGTAEPLRVLADAKSGQVLELRSEVVYATVTANIYPTTNTDPLVNVGLPFVNVSNGTTKTTDASGVYTYGSGTATSTLNGKYIKMSDGCGAISLSASSPGNLAFGGAGGTDCTTPGVGGAGNTHSSRTGHYHLTKINRKAVTFLPTNTWLAGLLTANMNINNTCNAFWNGTTVNFYRSGGGCSNTGEIAAVFLHEWGHGMDTKSGGAASENGSGEAVGDTFAFLETKDACIGKNFRPGIACTNCNASCTGVRDLASFASGGSHTIAKPANVTSDTGINCDRYACPYLASGISPYQGPMGYEGHCESYIASTANWDLAQTLVTKYGATSGWAAMDKIWYGSLTPSKSAYRLVSGGKCNAAAVVDGCASTNWYTVFLPADDNDGNLANGTPNACRIWDAFNAHGIACGTRPTCTTP